jgi:hypothetical protein
LGSHCLMIAGRVEYPEWTTVAWRAPGDNHHRCPFCPSNPKSHS